MDLLQPMKVADRAVAGVSDAGDGVEREVGLAREVVEAQHVVVEHREPDHRDGVGALTGIRGAATE